MAPRLVYAATARCPCGAGMAYDRDGESGQPTRGYWDCSAILLGTASREAKHAAQLPFSFYEIKGEDQPSARGATTRPLTRYLKPNGKPMRALRVLAERGESLDEDSVYWRAVRYGPTSGSFHEALRRLTRLGLAERTRASDFYRYEITLAGREYLEDRDV